MFVVWQQILMKCIRIWIRIRIRIRWLNPQTRADKCCGNLCNPIETSPCQSPLSRTHTHTHTMFALLAIKFLIKLKCCQTLHSVQRQFSSHSFSQQPESRSIFGGRQTAILGQGYIVCGDICVNPPPFRLSGLVMHAFTRSFSDIHFVSLHFLTTFQGLPPGGAPTNPHRHNRIVAASPQLATPPTQSPVDTCSVPVLHSPLYDVRLSSSLSFSSFLLPFKKKKVWSCGVWQGKLRKKNSL